MLKHACKQIALDAYKVLGIGRMASKSSITQAYDQLILGHPAEQISQARFRSHVCGLDAISLSIIISREE